MMAVDTRQRVDIIPAETNGLWDIEFENGDIKYTNGLETTVFISLLTDARAAADQAFAPEKRRGWLGNVASPVDGRDLGGLLWLVDQARLNQDTLNSAIDYANKALNWLVEDGLVIEIKVTGRIIPTKYIELNITLVSKTGDASNVYVPLWRNTIEHSYTLPEVVAPPPTCDDWLMQTGFWRDAGVWADHCQWPSD